MPGVPRGRPARLPKAATMRAAFLVAVISLALCAGWRAGAETMPPPALAAANWLTAQQVEDCFPGLMGQWIGANHIVLADPEAIATPGIEAIAEMQAFSAAGFTRIEPYYGPANRLQVAFDPAHSIIAFRHSGEEELEIALIGGASAPSSSIATPDLSAATLGGVRIGTSRAQVERRYGKAKRFRRACGMTLVEYVSRSGTYFFDVVYAGEAVRAALYGNVL